jgi:nucleoside-diphosphate-sugar epimerase
MMSISHQRIPKEKVLITGGTGFIGGHLVRLLCRSNVEIKCLVLPDETAQPLERLRIRIVKGDITDKRSLTEAVTDVDTIYHLAGIMVHDNPDMFYKINLEGTINLIEVCKERGIRLKRFLFVSSISAFGPTGECIRNEDCLPNPVNDYGKSKQMAEDFLKSSVNPFPYTIVRPVEIYGPGRFDSFYHICQAAQKGFRFDFGRGEITLGYVSDIVRGMIQACESPVAQGKTYFLGENRIYSLSEVVHLFSRAVRKRLITIRIPYSLLYSTAFILEVFSKVIHKKPVVTRWQVASYVRECYWKFDISKAERDLDFKTQVSLPEGARITVDWYKKEGYL